MIKKKNHNPILFGELIEKNFKESIIAKKNFIRTKKNIQNLKIVCEQLKTHINLGGKIYFAGNGGSASDSLHLSTELVSRLEQDRKAIASENLISNTSLLTAISNDYSFEKIFSRQIEANVTQKDIFFAITTSGNSKNILNALKKCKEKKIKSILLTGLDGGKAKKIADYSICVPSKRTQTIQEVHILIGHCICEILERSVIK
ncbi:SIS domain-containing protein [Candidatus Pelagibacter sp.]|nr:SIS domain-containing protein [Candidatus Pelagibacter sp.]